MAKKSASSKGKSTRGAPAAAAGGGRAGARALAGSATSKAAPVPEIIAIDNGTAGDTTFEFQRCQKVRIIGNHFTPFVTVYLSDVEVEWVPFVVQKVRRKKILYYNPMTPAVPPAFRDAVEIHAVPMLRSGVTLSNRSPGDDLGGTGDVTGTVSNDPPKPSTKGSKTQSATFNDPN